MPSVFVKQGRIKPLLYRHPWVFADSVDRVEGEVGEGAVVDVRAPDGRFLSRGFYSGASRLRVRSFAFEEGAEPDAGWIRERLRAAIAYRHDTLGLPGEATDCYRLVHGDADHLPGLVVDRFGEHLVIQITTAGLEARRAVVLDALEEALAPRSIVEAPDLKTREKEGLGPVERVQRGAPPEGGHTVVRELGLAYEVDLLTGQKTGFFCDHRESRALVRRLARGRRVLDGFCYTGAFGLNAAAGGAERVDAIDSSAPVLEVAQRNAERNQLVVALHKGDLFKLLGAWRRDGRRFDLTVLDPPKYGQTRRDVPRALQKLKELFALGVAVTSPGGVMLACSCAGLIDDAALESVLREVSRTSGRDLRVFHRGEQAPDHPVSITCPEGRYLRAWFCHVA